MILGLGIYLTPLKIKVENYFCDWKESSHRTLNLRGLWACLFIFSLMSWTLKCVSNCSVAVRKQIKDLFLTRLDTSFLKRTVEIDIAVGKGAQNLEQGFQLSPKVWVELTQEKLNILYFIHSNFKLFCDKMVNNLWNWYFNQPS